MTNVKSPDKLPKYHESDLRVHSDLGENDRVLSWFEELHQAPIPKTVWLQCELALAEGFTNAIRHAHKYLPRDTPIDIEVRMYSNHLEIRIWDYGPPFDMTEWFKGQPEPDIFSPGGRGIKLMYAIADHVSYTRTSDRRNCLLIVKNYWLYPQVKNENSDFDKV
ncbi:ATP-binding protein [Okeania sp.]|uniref:ATP-binding protein n=1 Tax=Okeania sp. TaxID=3100323 RepID=UPI002B4AAEB6|nr:ATP-binding protein [Okeania sp.]MEB3341585.1 ATP-binding protein [Okeania sp.]